MGFADLHIHSLYSDGTHTPEEIVTLARARNVSLIAVCDHNVTAGTLLAMEAARDAGITCICGAEIDTMMHGRDLHILCYGADTDHEPLAQAIRYARKTLDGMSTDLFDRLKEHGYPVSIEGYNAFQHDPRAGGWKMLQYLQKTGITRDKNEAFALYDRFGVTYENAGFEAAEKIIGLIHAAGGYAVLAHPGVSLPTGNINLFERELNAVLDAGADGVECYYPRHDRGLTQTCLRVCKDRDRLITAGSDCHGAFNRNEIGCTRTAVTELVLKDLV